MAQYFLTIFFVSHKSPRAAFLGQSLLAYSHSRRPSNHFYVDLLPECESRNVGVSLWTCLTGFLVVSPHLGNFNMAFRIEKIIHFVSYSRNFGFFISFVWNSLKIRFMSRPFLNVNLFKYYNEPGTVCTLDCWFSLGVKQRASSSWFRSNIHVTLIPEWIE